MQVFLIILSVGFLLGILYFAFSPKSSRLLRLASIIALGLITVSILVCGIIIIKGPSEDEELVPFASLPGAVQQPAKQESILVDIIILAVILIIFGLIIFRAFREQRKQAAEQKKPAKSPALSKRVELDDLESEASKKFDIDIDDSFDLEL